MRVFLQRIEELIEKILMEHQKKQKQEVLWAKAMARLDNKFFIISITINTFASAMLLFVGAYYM